MLARLIELNAQRAKEAAAETLAAGGGPSGGNPKKGKGSRKGGGGQDVRALFSTLRCVETTPALRYPSKMPIAWTRPQRQRVQRALRDHPADSGWCEQAARRILPTAHERDAAAQIWQLWPADEDASFVIPKMPSGVLWYIHYTVEAEQHCVDALTGVDGTPRDSYLETHWKAPDQLRWVPDEEVTT